MEGHLINIDGADYTITPALRPTEVITTRAGMKRSRIDEHESLSGDEEDRSKGVMLGQYHETPADTDRSKQKQKDLANRMANKIGSNDLTRDVNS